MENNKNDMENNERMQNNQTNEQGDENKRQAEEMDTDVSKRNNTFLQFIKKYPVPFTALLGVLAVIIVFVWKDIQGQKKAREITNIAITQLQEKNQEMLRLIAKPLVWSIRSEMLRGNMEQVDMLTVDMVKERNFQFLYLIEPGGIIILSTDKKKEGQQFEENYQEQIMMVESTIVFQQEENLIIVAAPVMGYDKRLATLIMAYTPDDFKNK